MSYTFFLRNSLFANFGLKQKIASVIYEKAGIDYKTKQLNPFPLVTYYLAPKIIEMNNYREDNVHVLESSSLKFLSRATQKIGPHHFWSRIELVKFSADEKRIDFMQETKNSSGRFETIIS